MFLDDIFESELSLRRTIWSKRGDKITKRDVETIAADDIRPRTQITVVKKDETDAD